MGGRGRTPKPPETRQRRNRTTTAAVLPSQAESARRRVPPLPKRARGSGKWHGQVVAWWKSVWRSPMAEEFLGPDMLGGLYCLAELYQRRWTETGTAALVSVMGEIRHQEVRFGLTPIDRRRLQWEVPRSDPSADRPAKPSAPAVADPSVDPRSVLKAI